MCTRTRNFAILVHTRAAHREMQGFRGLPGRKNSGRFHADQGKTGTGRRRSQSGCAIMMGGSLIAYHSRGQKNVTLSTAESECQHYMSFILDVQLFIYVFATIMTAPSRIILQSRFR